MRCRAGNSFIVIRPVYRVAYIFDYVFRSICAFGRCAIRYPCPSPAQHGCNNPRSTFTILSRQRHIRELDFSFPLCEWSFLSAALIYCQLIHPFSFVQLRNIYFPNEDEHIFECGSDVFSSDSNSHVHVDWAPRISTERNSQVQSVKAECTFRQKRCKNNNNKIGVRLRARLGSVSPFRMTTTHKSSSKFETECENVVEFILCREYDGIT